MEKFVLVLICVSIFGILLAVNISWTSKLLMGMLLFGMIGQSMFEDNPPPPGPPVAGAPPGPPVAGAPPGPPVAGALPGPPVAGALPGPPAQPAVSSIPSLAASQVANLTPAPSVPTVNPGRARLANMKAATAERTKNSRVVSGFKKRDVLAFGAFTSAWAIHTILSRMYYT
ncbi:hypothetical protein EXVG_00366 [Emiliania huxleyi virus 202]|nr:hypothetical protein EXVG_00366 [Emiliania huxleyi virus 202]AHA54267.1 putative membrane protein [Emiliania huxleyi virus 18]AHA55313.1 putative membrane protein [Emiliania huxleyi virus 156]